ncbi:hypothetical protein GCM10010372_44110 [Streptomyces tauricus]|nr:hypothetical protein GCM10010372_44110 [Streptomyces tauricus]
MQGCEVRHSIQADTHIVIEQGVVAHLRAAVDDAVTHGRGSQPFPEQLPQRTEGPSPGGDSL